MHINDLVQLCHNTAVAKGWWEEPRTALEVAALIHSEVSEAVEEARKPNSVSWKLKEGEKPEGEAVELVDAVIRIFDYFGHRGWNFEKLLVEKMAYNEGRSYRHGGKKA